VRRAVAVCGWAAAAMLLATACAPDPPGSDRDLVGGWPMLPSPALVEPVAPACYALPGAEASGAVRKWPAAVACSEAHTVELVSVGRLTGAAADRPTPPPSDRAAYAKCAADANALLGGDWRTGRVSLSVDLPYQALWDAGARWFRCDLQALGDLDRFTPVSRTASLRGALAPGGELLAGCVTVTQPPGGKPNDIDRVLPSSCTVAHQAEFVGLFEPPDGPYPDDVQRLDLAGCRPKVAAYVGVPDDANFPSRTGLITMPYDRAAWEMGNRGARCFVWPLKPVSTSLKGAGTKALPINTD
jgi:hypothetical protein